MSDDLKAPKRIWAAKSASGKCHVGFDTPSLEYTNEYVRADLFDKALEALREIAGSVPYADNPWHIALAVLAELEGKDV